MDNNNQDNKNDIINFEILTEDLLKSGGYFIPHSDQHSLKLTYNDKTLSRPTYL